jgi:hypothetical protein
LLRIEWELIWKCLQNFLSENYSRKFSAFESFSWESNFCEFLVIIGEKIERKFNLIPKIIEKCQIWGEKRIKFSAMESWMKIQSEENFISVCGCDRMFFVVGTARKMLKKGKREFYEFVLVENSKFSVLWKGNFVVGKFWCMKVGKFVLKFSF